MFPTYRTILCCHGLGPLELEVLAHAFGLARTCGGEVVVAHAFEPLSPQVQNMLEVHLPTDRMRELREDARRRIGEEIARHVREIPEGVGTAHLRGIRVVEGGRPADALLEVAREEEADLIVMGTHHHTTVGELLLGSTAHRVAQRSPLPVLLVRLSG